MELINVYTLLFYFFFYSFMGWLLEGTFSLVTNKTFIRPNFLISPIKPMYGLTAAVLVVIKDMMSFYWFLLAAAILPTLIEYLTAWLMVSCFRIKFWDYSDVHFNCKGYICLKFSIYWILLSVLLVLGIHPAVRSLYWASVPIWHFVAPIILCLFIVDCVLTISFYAAHTKDAPS